MSTITTIAGTDPISASRAILNTNFANLNSDKAEKSGQVFTGPISAPNLSGTNTGDQTLNSLLPTQTSNSGKYLQTNGTNASWQPLSGTNGGTVTTASVATANGFAGTVANATSTPAITITTSVTGLLKGNGTAVSAAVAGTDYSTPTGTETQTNKTLTAPILNKPVINATNPTAQVYTPTAGGAATCDLGVSNQHRITMPAGNITIALTNDTNSQIFVIAITQDSVGSRTVTWFSTIKWPGGIVPTLTTTANKRDVFGFIRTGTNTYDGFIIGQNL